ncbi:MAG: acyl-CoA synthetase FdrA [Chloroflexi bacterium]|nr:acyl-CoA synthetase FdrA [Chloroflexota bacterium]
MARSNLIVQTLIKPGEYRDSVALMLIARELTALPGVADVSVVMGTPANKAVLAQAGLLNDAANAATPNDLLIAVKAKDDAAARAALHKAQELLAQRAASPQIGSAARPRTLRAALRATPGANLAIVSVAGQYAAAQAWDALRAGLHVLLFSDHVAVEDEIALKEYARDQGLLLMGPGAGTALINGVGLGFANAVPRGNIGIVAAAGTGLQEVSTLIAKAGAGITQGIGTGGRDVSERVGGIMMLEGLRALQADPKTRVIVIVSKLPAPSVTEKILAQVGTSDKPTVLALMSNLSLRGAIFATKQSPIREVEIASHKTLAMTARDLREAAALAVALSRGESVNAARKKLAAEDRALAIKARALRRKLNARQRYARGLYSGGTLCEETMRIWQASLGAVWSNAPLDPKFKLPDSNQSRRHTVVDLGEEEFTIGRPHPMIDNSVRVKRLLQEARDPSVAVIALDVVIGYGAHPDPAAELGAAIAEAKAIARKRGRELIVVASVTGTENDPQSLSRQTIALKKAGTIVLESNAVVAKFASCIVG